MTNENWLTYPCAACGGIAIHDTGPHYLDNGTRLYCNICGGETVVVFQAAQQGIAAELLPSEADDDFIGLWDKVLD